MNGIITKKIDTDMTDEEKADIYEQRWTIGWLRAKYDGRTKGYFASTHYPEGSAEWDGYESFSKAVRARSAA